MVRCINVARVSEDDRCRSDPGQNKDDRMDIPYMSYQLACPLGPEHGEIIRETEHSGGA